ncbi:MAG: hypothetical protein JO307_30105 [Bryobacterales bacterium]|nr:hypothetical protein [Bryobacterales bacterium]
MLRQVTVFGRAAAALAVAFLVQSPAPAQSKHKTYEPPRLSDGKPDLNGIWNGPAIVNNDLQAAKVNGKGVIVDPANGKIPYLPGATPRVKKNLAARKQLDPVNHCFMPGVPRMMYMPDPYMIVQTPGFVAILSQFMHEVRNIPVDGSKHLENIDLWQGDSRGRWEGDTFVVDTNDFNDKTWFDAAGNFHSDHLHVVERFTRTGPNTITYEVAISDPMTFSKDWKIRMPLTLNAAKDAQILENECNYKLEGPTVTEGTRPDPHRPEPNRPEANREAKN